MRAKLKDYFLFAKFFVKKSTIFVPLTAKPLWEPRQDLSS
jgi:hypothetical protein